MSLFINTNSEATIAQNNLAQTSKSLNSATTDLSSGLRINTAADDAAGYSIVADLTGQVNGLSQASSNAQDAVSLVQTADGGLNDVQQVLQRVRELAVEYNGGTLNTSDQNAIVSEVGQLASEISDIQSQSQFNGISLFTGSTVTFQVGANDGDTISAKMADLSTLAGAVSSLSLSSATVLSTIDSYIDGVSKEASQLGAVQNRLGYTLDNLSTYKENLSSAQSTIQDVDMAAETAIYSQQSVLEQSGISMLSQAEQAPQQVLKLIQNL